MLLVFVNPFSHLWTWSRPGFLEGLIKIYSTTASFSTMCYNKKSSFWKHNFKRNIMDQYKECRRKKNIQQHLPIITEEQTSCQQNNRPLAWHNSQSNCKLTNKLSRWINDGGQLSHGKHVATDISRESKTSSGKVTCMKDVDTTKENIIKHSIVNLMRTETLKQTNLASVKNLKEKNNWEVLGASLEVPVYFPTGIRDSSIVCCLIVWTPIILERIQTQACNSNCTIVGTQWVQ